MSEINFQPMPKRFMVWDTLLEDWRKCKLPGQDNWGYVFEIHQLSVFLVNASNNGLPHTRFIICQSTNLFDEDNEEIFEGSILKSTQNKIGIVKCLVDEGRYAIYYPNYGWTALDVLSAGDNKNIGHILANPELVEKKDV